MDRGRLSEIGTWVLVLCAVLTTSVVIRRELVPGSMARKAKYVDGWEEALTVGIRSGSADALVQVVEFADFQCPFCAHFEAIVKTIRERYPDQVAFTFAPFPLPYHEFAEPAQRVAECADMQGRFEAMRSLLFEKHQAFGSVEWTDFAMQAGIENIDQFNACVNDTEPSERIERSRKLADKIGVRGTPTIIINGWKVPVPPSVEDFDRIVENVAESRPPVSGLDFPRHH